MKKIFQLMCIKTYLITINVEKIYHENGIEFTYLSVLVRKNAII